jgi:hypothetical protein
MNNRQEVWSDNSPKKVSIQKIAYKKMFNIISHFEVQNKTEMS